ncbi:sigma-70 family RNA polymerase sigma factor [candidate division KSB1 bacterium]|nr:sigma-70 family RNA polymerase sigma factor [candidate division KSB1 bacterium]
MRECAHEFVRRDRMPSRVTAEDFAQEVATAFLSQVHNIRYLPGWLGAVCASCRAAFMRKRYREAVDSIEAMLEKPGTEVPDSLQAEPESSRIEARLEVELLIQRLQPEQRVVLAMRLLDGMEYDEIARQLNKSVDTVRLLYFRAKKNLVSLMNPKHGEDRHHGLDAHRAQKR